MSESASEIVGAHTALGVTAPSPVETVVARAGTRREHLADIRHIGIVRDRAEAHRARHRR